MSKRLTVAVLVLGLLASASSAFAEGRFEIQFRASNPAGKATAPLPPLPGFPIQLVLDDSAAEGDTGVNGASAAQFLWLNRFDPTGQAVQLEEVWVLFNPGDNMMVGGDIQLAIFADTDADPSNGATLLTTVDETIQVLDGINFSVYTLAMPVAFTATEHLLIGVVPRFIQAGVTSPTLPAAVDTSSNPGQSWLATWVSGTVPSPPALPSDNLTTTVTGNWMIRGFGSPVITAPPTADIPALSPLGLLLLGLLLPLVAAPMIARRSREHRSSRGR